MNGMSFNTCCIVIKLLPYSRKIGKKREMKLKFSLKLQCFKSNPNCALLSTEKYKKYIKKKDGYDCWMMRYYDVLHVDW